MSKRFSVEPGEQKPWKKRKGNPSELENWRSRKYKEEEEERWKEERRAGQEGVAGREQTNDPRVKRATWSTSSFCKKDDVQRSQKKEEKSWSRVKSERGRVLNNSASFKRESGESPSGGSNKIKGKVRDKSIERLLKMKDELLGEIEKQDEEEEVEFELFKAKVIKKKMLKDKRMSSVLKSPERKVSVVRTHWPKKYEPESDSDLSSSSTDKDKLIKTETQRHNQSMLKTHERESICSDDFDESDLSLLTSLDKKRKLKKKKKSLKKKSKDKKIEKKDGKSRLHTSDVSSEDELVKMLKRRKNKKQPKERDFEKRKRSIDNSDVQKDVQNSSLDETNIEPDQVTTDVKEEIIERSHQENSKADDKGKESNASLEAIKRILQRNVEVEVVDLESDDDIQEIPLCFQTPKKPPKKGDSTKQPMSVENIKQEQEVVTLVEPEEDEVDDIESEAEFRETSKKREQKLVYVDIEANADGSLNRIEILTPSSEESCWISETSSEDLAAAFIKDVKEKCRPGQVLVVPCLSTFHLLLTSVALSPQHVDALDSLFSGWLDLASLQVRLCSPAGATGGWLVASQHQTSRVDRLLASQLQPAASLHNASKTGKMMQFLSQLLEESKGSLEPFILPFCLPIQSYLVVTLHVCIQEVPVSDSHQRTVITGLGFKCSSSLSHHYISINPSQGKEMQGKTEKEALESFIKCVQDRRDVEGEEGVVVLTPRLCKGLPLFLAALARHHLMQHFQELVDGVGSIEDLAVKKRIRLMGETSLDGYERYYFKRFGRDVDLSAPAEVAPAVYQILEELLLFSKPTFANCISTLCHPLVSGFTLKLLRKVPYLQEGVYEATMNEKLFLRPGDEEIVSVQLGSVPRTLIGQEFVMNSYGQAECGKGKTVLDEDYLMLICIKNSGSDILCLDKGVPLGLASTSDKCPFTEVKKRETTKDEENAGLETKGVVSVIQTAEILNFEKEVSPVESASMQDTHLPTKVIPEKGEEKSSPTTAEGKGRAGQVAETSHLDEGAPSQEPPTILKKRETEGEEVPTATMNHEEPTHNLTHPKEHVDAAPSLKSSTDEIPINVLTNMEQVVQLPGQDKRVSDFRNEKVGDQADTVTPKSAKLPEDDDALVRVDTQKEFAASELGDSPINDNKNKSSSALQTNKEIPNDEPAVFDVESDDETSQEMESSKDNADRHLTQGNKEKSSKGYESSNEPKQPYAPLLTELFQSELRVASNKSPIPLHAKATHSLATVEQLEQAQPLSSHIPSDRGRSVLLETDETKERRDKDLSMGTIGLEIIEEPPSSDEEIKSASSSPIKMYFESEKKVKNVDSEENETQLPLNGNDLHVEELEDDDIEDNRLDDVIVQLEESEDSELDQDETREDELENHQQRLNSPESIKSVFEEGTHPKEREEVIFSSAEEAEKSRKAEGESESFGDESPPRRKLSKCPSSSISYSHSPHFISSILRQSVAPTHDTNVPDTAAEVEFGQVDKSPEYPVLHLVEDAGTGAIVQAEAEPVDADLQKLAAEAASKGREVQEENRHKDSEDWVLNLANKILGKKELIKGKGKAKKEDWVVGKKTKQLKSNTVSALPQRRSERVFIKDSVINYAEPAEEEKEKEEERSPLISQPSHESPLKENPQATVTTMASIPLENLSLSTIAKISQKESEKDTDYGIESDSRMKAGKCPTCEKTFSRQNFSFRQHKARCAMSSSSRSTKTDERRECPVCCKSYTMIGRGLSYYKDHIKACEGSNSKKARNNIKNNLDECEAKENKEDDRNEREMINDKSGAEMIDPTNDIGCTFEERRKRSRRQVGGKENNSTKKGTEPEGGSTTEINCETQEANLKKDKRKQKDRSATNERSTIKEGDSTRTGGRTVPGGKRLDKFLSSLGLFDPEGAMVGIVRMSTEPINTCPRAQNKDEEPIMPTAITDECKHVPTDNAETMSETGEKFREIAPKRKGLIHDSPLLPQIHHLARHLPNLTLDQSEDLSLHFPSLLAVPHLVDVIRVFLRFHQRSPDDLSKTERQFADLLVTELHCSEIEDMRQLEELVLAVYQRKPDANIDLWIRELTLANPGLESMALADQMETYFDLDIAIQVQQDQHQHQHGSDILCPFFFSRFFCCAALTLFVKANLI